LGQRKEGGPGSAAGPHGYWVVLAGAPTGPAGGRLG
jgi:hypothetical protein